MKKNSFRKITALLLAFLMFATILGACKKEETPISTYYSLSQKTLALDLADTKVGSLIVRDDSFSDKTHTETWKSSNESVAIVDNGMVYAVAQGQATITATVTVEGHDPFDLTCVVTVANTVVEVKNIYLTQSAITLDVGATGTVTAIIDPSNATNSAVTWTSSNPSVAVVSGGNITAVAAGTAVVTATSADGKVSASCNVTVESPENQVESLKLNRSTRTVYVGKTYKLTATVTPSDTGLTVVWTSSDESVAEVDSTGLVVAKKKGTATITASIQDKLTTHKATCKITVAEEEEPTEPKVVKATSVDLPSSLAITKGEGSSWSLTATVKPSNTTETAKWKSSNDKLLSVDSKGNLTPHFDEMKTGTEFITITCTVGSHSDSCTIVLTNKVSVPATDITLSSSSVSITVGSTKKITATLTPSNSTDKITWKSLNEDIATVDENGVITAKAIGTAPIMATTDSGKMKYLTVTVTSAVQATVTLDPTSLSLVIGEKSTLKKTVTPANTVLLWQYTSSNTQVATVNNDVVTAVGVGTATITLRGVNTETGEQICTATCNVTVTATAQPKTVSVGIDIYKNNVKVNPATTRFTSMDSLKAVLTFTPALTENELNQLYMEIISSDDDIVQPSYVIRGVYEFDLGIWQDIGSVILTPRITGPENITFKYNSISLNIHTPDVSIVRPITSLNLLLSTNRITLNEGDTRIIPYQVSPVNNDDRLVFTTSDPNIVTVSSDGHITAQGPGTATVSLYAVGNNPARVVSASFSVTVTGSITDNGAVITMPSGSTYTYKFDTSLGTFMSITPGAGSASILIDNITGTITVLETAANNDSRIMYVNYIDKNNMYHDKGLTVRITVRNITAGKYNPHIVSNTASINVRSTGSFVDYLRNSGIEIASGAEFSSNREEILAITTFGQYTANKVGTAYISVKYDGIEYLKVKVEVKDNTIVSSKTLNVYIEDYGQGLMPESVLAIPSSIPTTNRTYTSSNTAVATISNLGIVTLRSTGTTTITVKSGNYIHTITLKVGRRTQNPPVAAATFTVEELTATFDQNNSGAVQVTLTSLSSGTSAQVSFSISSANGADAYFDISPAVMPLNVGSSGVALVSAKQGVDMTNAPTTVIVNCTIAGVSRQAILTFQK